MKKYRYVTKRSNAKMSYVEGKPLILLRNLSKAEWRVWISKDIDYVKQCPKLPIPPDEPAASQATGQFAAGEGLKGQGERY